MGSGGSSSGKVDYPDYMKDFHGNILNHAGTESVNLSVAQVINATMAYNPWVLASAYDPDNDISAYEAVIAGFKGILSGISDTADWAALLIQAKASIGPVGGITEAIIVADVAAFANQLDDEIVTKVLPRFRGGMRDINAVVSSSFVVGQSVIEGFRDREVAKHASGLRLSAAYKNADIELEVERLYLTGSSQMLQLMLQRISWEESYMRVLTESKRIKIVAKKEETDVNIHIDERNGLWNIETFQHGGNLLSSIGGASVVTGGKGQSTASSVIGGGMSGAAAGGMVGGAIAGGQAGSVVPVYGTIIGAVLGAAAGYLSSM